MIKITVDISEALPWVTKMSGEAERYVQKGLDKAADKVVDVMKSKVPIGFTGRLHESIEVFEKEKLSRTIGPGGSYGSSKSPNPKWYAFYVDRGAPAHFPNVSDLEEKAGSMSNAWALAKYLKDKPTKPVHFEEKTAAEAGPIFIKELMSSVEDLIR